MAAARDQAARILRAEPDTAEGGTVRDTSAVLADQLRAHISEDVVARRPAGVPASDNPAIDKPGSFTPEDVGVHGALAGLIAELNGPEFRAAVEKNTSAPSPIYRSAATLSAAAPTSSARTPTGSPTTPSSAPPTATPKASPRSPSLRATSSATGTRMAATTSPTAWATSRPSTSTPTFPRATM